MVAVLAQATPSLDGNAVIAFVLFDVAVILVAARAVGGLAKRIGQPAVVGEILAGILLGPTLLGRSIFAWDRPWSFLNCDAALAASGADPSITACLFPPQARGVLGVIGQIALLLFMFLVGLELDFGALRGKGRSIAVVGFGVVAVPLALAFAIQPVLYNELFVPGFGTPEAPSTVAFSLMVGAMLAVTAFPVMVRILQEKNLTTSPLGAVGIAAAAVVTVLMFLVVSIAAGVAGGASTGALGLRLLWTAVYLAAMFGIVKPLLAPLGRRYERNVVTRGGPADDAAWSTLDKFGPSGVGWALTPGMFATILVVVFASGLVAHLLGINVIVGGFVAGAVLPARRGLIRDMTATLFDLTAIVLLPVFLAFSGLNTDFTQLRPSALVGIGVLLVAAVAAKWGGGALCGRLAGLSWRDSNALGVLMNCRGLLVLVVGLIAVQQGVIAGPLQLGGVVMALVTTAMTGPLFDRIMSSQASEPVAAVPVPPPQQAGR